MSHYPQIPQPGSRPDVPRAYDPRVRLPPLEAVVQFLGNQSFTTYLVESRPVGTDCWEIRPGHEHRGGRPWLRSPHRIVNVSGVWSGSALAFSDRSAALQCARWLRDAEPSVEFRVIPVMTSVECGEPVEI